MTRPRIAPVLIPHGICAPGCFYCPPNRFAGFPGADEVAAALERAGGPAEVAFHGGDFRRLPAAVAEQLNSAARVAVATGAASGFRVTSGPSTIAATPADWWQGGPSAVEIPAGTLDDGVLASLGRTDDSALLVRVVRELLGRGVRVIVHLAPGLPGSSHATAVASARRVASLGVHAARVLPALALEGTASEEALSRGWIPMSVEEAVITSAAMVAALREGGVEVIRVGLQPGVDLRSSPTVLAGPHHPGLRQRVEAELLRDAATRALHAAFVVGTSAFTFVVHPREEAYVRGHENDTLRSLARRYRLERLQVRTSRRVPLGCPVVLPGAIAPGDVERALGEERNG